MGAAAAAAITAAASAATAIGWCCCHCRCRWCSCHCSCRCYHCSCSCCLCCCSCHRCDNLRCLWVGRSEGCYCCCRNRCWSASAAGRSRSGFMVSSPVEVGALRHSSQLTACLLKISVQSINLVWEQRFGILKRTVGRSLNCYVINLNLWISSA